MAGLLPYTGKEFLDSLNDGREVWIYGERVKNITEHPAFRNTARMIARLYDALHRDHAEQKNVLTRPTEWGGFTHPYFVATALGRGADCGPRRDRRLVPADLRLARPLTRLQGGVSRHPWRQRRIL
jgi:4-hydroxyphenylacetate 3-hydroxylase N terminal